MGRAVEQEQLARLSGTLERGVHALGLAIRDDGVRRAVDQQHRRCRVARMVHRRRDPHPRLVGHALAEQLADRIEAVGQRAPPREVVRAVVKHDRPHGLGDAVELRGQLRRQLGNGCRQVRQHREMRARRQAHQRDPVGVDAELAGVRADVAERAPDVVERRREAVSRREPVRDGDRRDAMPGEVERVAGGLARVAVDPRAAMDEYDRGRGPGDPARPVVVVPQRHTVGRRVDDVLDELVRVGLTGNARHLAGEAHAQGLSQEPAVLELRRAAG